MNFSTLRSFVELPVNPANFEHRASNSVIGQNNQRWDEALVRLGLTVAADYPAHSVSGEQLPGIKATLVDEALLGSNQFAYLSMVSRDHLAGLGAHMAGGADTPPRELSVTEVLADISAVTVGGVVRHPDIPPARFGPMLGICRYIGTLELLTQFTAQNDLSQ